MGISEGQTDSQSVPRSKQSWRRFGGLLDVLGGLLGHPRGSRRPKTAQDHCKAYKDGFTLAGRAQRASERSERSERSDQDETELAEHKRRRRNSNGVTGATGLPRGVRQCSSHTQHFTEVYVEINVFHMCNFIADDSPTSTRFPFMLKQVQKY